MRIACLVPEFPRLSETFILQPIARLVARGHDVRIFSTHRPEEATVDTLVDRHDLRARTRYWDLPLGHGARLAGAPRALLPALFRRPAALLRTILPGDAPDLRASLLLPYAAARLAGTDARFDVIHAHLGPAGRLAAALRAAGAIHGPLVTSFYGYDLTQEIARRGAAWYRDLFRLGDHFLVPSELWRRELAALGCPAERIGVQHLPVDCADAFRPPQTRPEEPPFRVISIARFVEKKGLPDGLRAVAALRRRGVDARYTILGDGPMRSELVARIEDLDATSWVTLRPMETRDRVRAALDASHVLLAPSRTAADGDREGTPVVILEAMACGLPVVSTRHSGIPEIVAHGETGLLAAEGDVTALTDALASLADRSERRAALGHAGRARVCERHDLEPQVERLLALYGALGEDPPRT